MNTLLDLIKERKSIELQVQNEITKNTPDGYLACAHSHYEDISISIFEDDNADSAILFSENLEVSSMPKKLPKAEVEKRKQIAKKIFEAVA